MWKADEISIRKPIQLIVEVIVFQELIALSDVWIKGASISHCIMALVPKNYFVTLYTALYIICPLINRGFSVLSKDQFKKWIYILVILFAVEPITVDIIEGFLGKSLMGTSTIGILGADWGYTIVTFLLVYIVASYCGKFNIHWSMEKSAFVFCSATVILTIWKMIEVKIGTSIGAEHYQNPVIIIEAISAFMLFSNFKIQSRIINQLSKGCFTVFIVHSRFIQIYPILNPDRMELIVLIGNLFIRTIALFAICDFGGLWYAFLEKRMFDFIESKIGFYRLNIGENKTNIGE